MYRRDGGLTTKDKARIVVDLRELNATDFPNTSPFGNPAGPTAVTPYQLSQDGTTALIANTIKGNGKSDTLLDPINRYREPRE